MSAALEIRGLDVFYGRVQALHGVSLEVGRGELVTLVGPNGAGKTTLLRAVTGMVPVRAGTVLFEGVPITGRPTEAIVHLGLSIVPEGRLLFGPLSVRDNLALGAYARGRAGRRQTLRADLERVLAPLRGEGLSMLLVEQNARAAFRIADRGYALGPGGRPGSAGRATHEAYGLELVEEETPR